MDLSANANNPASKLMRYLNLSVDDCQKLDILQLLQQLPRKQREKYGKRKSLTQEEKSELTKQRNREHARCTRERKKIVLNALQVQVAQLESKLSHILEHPSRDSSGSDAQDVKRRSNIEKFMSYCCNTEPQPTKEEWADILLDSFTLTMPSLPVNSPRGRGSLALGDEHEVCVGLGSFLQLSASLPTSITNLLWAENRNVRDEYTCRIVHDLDVSSLLYSADKIMGSSTMMVHLTHKAQFASAQVQMKDPPAGVKFTAHDGTHVKAYKKEDGGKAIAWEGRSTNATIHMSSGDTPTSTSTHTATSTSAPVDLPPLAVRCLVLFRFRPCDSHLMGVELKFDIPSMCEKIEKATNIPITPRLIEAVQRTPSSNSLGPSFGPLSTNHALPFAQTHAAFLIPPPQPLLVSASSGSTSTDIRGPIDLRMNTRRQHVSPGVRYASAHNLMQGGVSMGASNTGGIGGGMRAGFSSHTAADLFNSYNYNFGARVVRESSGEVRESSSGEVQESSAGASGGSADEDIAMDDFINPLGSL